MRNTTKSKKNHSQTARAYCSSANLGPGFDVFGLALDAFYDEVSVTKIDNTNSAKIIITCENNNIKKIKLPQHPYQLIQTPTQQV